MPRLPSGSGMRGALRLMPVIAAMLWLSGSTGQAQNVRGAGAEKPPALLSGLGSHTHAISTQDPDAQKFFDQGLTLLIAFNRYEALRSFQRAAELDPGQADARYTLGVTLWQQGDFAAAAEELRAAIRVKPDYAEAYYTLGTVLKQKGEFEEAAKALREAIRLQPQFAGAHTTLAAVLRQLGDAQGAAEESRRGAEIAKQKTNEQTALFATNSGRRLLNAGDIDGAISQFRAAINSEPNSSVEHYQLGLALEQSGKKDEAKKEFEKAAELDAKANGSSK